MVSDTGTGSGQTNNPWLEGGLLGGLGALAGVFPEDQSGTVKSNQNTTSDITSDTATSTDMWHLLNTWLNSLGITQQEGTTAQQVTPTLGPEATALMQNLATKYTGLTAPALTGYQAYQTGNINNAADLQSQAVNNILAARGLSTSPAAATAQAGVEQNRLNQITGMKQQIPILQNQLNLANLAGATGFFSTMPRGASTTGTTSGTTTSSQSQTGGQAGQDIGGTQVKGHQFTAGNEQGFQQKDATSGGGLGGLFSGLASGLAAAAPYIFASDKNLKKDIKEITQDKAISKIRELKSKEWTWKGGSSKSSGVIAQELEEVLPELVETVKVKDLDIKAVNYVGLIPYLIGAVQNLDSRISAEG